MRFEPYAKAKARVQSGDLSFEAISAMTLAHADMLMAQARTAREGLSRFGKLPFMAICLEEEAQRLRDEATGQ